MPEIFDSYDQWFAWARNEFLWDGGEVSQIAKSAFQAGTESGTTLVGHKIYGYCGGYFGRDSYGDKTIEGYGEDWLVCRDEDGHACFASRFANFESLLNFVKTCSDPGLAS